MDKHTNTNNAILDQLNHIKQIINLYFHIKIAKLCSQFCIAQILFKLHFDS